VRLLRFLVLIIAAGAVLSVAVVAQNNRNEDTSTRIVHGTVIDSRDHPINGAVVQCKDTKTLQVRSFVTQAKGEYHFYGLSMNSDYQLHASHDGATSKTKLLSVFDTDKDSKIDLKIK
jgi:hypothetical protein